MDSILTVPEMAKGNRRTRFLITPSPVKLATLNGSANPVERKNLDSERSGLGRLRFNGYYKSRGVYFYNG